MQITVAEKIAEKPGSKCGQKRVLNHSEDAIRKGALQTAQGHIKILEQPK